MKKLEEMLDLPESRRIININSEKNKKPESKKINFEAEQSFRDIAEFDSLAASLPQVRGLGDIADAEFDMLANRAINAYDDLMDLGMNVESKYSGKIFEVAANMIKCAIEAKAQKMDAKLRTIEMQLRKRKLDLDELSVNHKINSNVVQVNVDNEQKDGVVLDRNSLLERLRNLNTDLNNDTTT